MDILIQMNKFHCSCGRAIEWKYLKLEKGECWFGKMKDKILNCVNFAETFNIYS